MAANIAIVTLVCCMVSKSKSKRLRCIRRWFGRDLMEHLFLVFKVTAWRSPVFDSPFQSIRVAGAKAIGGGARQTEVRMYI